MAIHQSALIQLHPVVHCSCMEVLASVLELLLRLRPALGAPQGGFQVDSLGLVCGRYPQKLTLWLTVQFMAPA
jgi:hypothetical protein